MVNGIKSSELFCPSVSSREIMGSIRGRGWEENIIDRYHSVEDILYVIIAIVGVHVNLMAIVILSRGKCGISTCTTRYLVAMASADLLVIIVEVILYQLPQHYFPWSFLTITPVFCVIVVLTYTAIDCSVWFTVTFTFDRFVAICCQKLKTKYCNGKTATAILATAGVLMFLKNVPFYVLSAPAVIINNVPRGCKTMASIKTNPRWKAFTYFNKVSNPLVPFAVILMLNGLTLRQILVASRVRQGLRGLSKEENRIDPEMESRRKSVVLLFVISGSFIVLWLPLVIYFLYDKFRGNSKVPNVTVHIADDLAHFLSNLSCCTNTFIYVATQSKFREQMKGAVKYPFASVLRLINKSPQ